MDRIEKIRAKRASMDAEADAKVQAMNDNVARYTKAIKGLKNRLNEMFKVADEMVANRIRFGGAHIHLGMEWGDVFETNGIDHNLGFYFEYKKGWGREFHARIRVLGIGIAGGGCCGSDIMIDRNGDIIKNPLDNVIGLWTYEKAYGDFCGKAERFLNGFDVFEKRFYDYIDNL